MYNYAQLDENGYVMALSDLSGVVDLPNMVLLSEEEIKKVKLLSRYVNGEWLEQDLSS